ncbi:MAG: hypothetical protein IPM79_27580 [Polyangiaceae bacterium]|nr:hypothetical protein [Polyangiaceae bacterium]
MSQKTVARPHTSAKTAAAPKRARSIVLGDPDLEVLNVDLVRPDGRVLRVRLDAVAETVNLEVDRAEGEEHFRAYDVVAEWSGPPRPTIEEAERDAEEHNEGCARQGGLRLRHRRRTRRRRPTLERLHRRDDPGPLTGAATARRGGGNEHRSPGMHRWARWVRRDG